MTEYTKQYYALNKEKLNAYSSWYHSENKSRINERTRQYKLSHKEEIKEQRKQYRKVHKEKINAENVSRQCQQINRTPIWANLNQIQQIYLECPEGHHVDHIVPLNGEIVSGLHVEYNLQYLSIKENLMKHNKFPYGDYF